MNTPTPRYGQDSVASDAGDNDGASESKTSRSESAQRGRRRHRRSVDPGYGQQSPSETPSWLQKDDDGDRDRHRDDERFLRDRPPHWGNGR